MRATATIGRWCGATTINRRILHAAATVGLFSVVVKIAAMFKEVTVANYLGRGDACDAFLLAYLLPGFIVALVAGSLNAAFIPTFIQVRQREGEDAAQRLFSSCMIWSQGLLIVLAAILAGIGPFLLRTMALGFATDKLRLCAHLFYAMLPVVLLSGIATNCSAVLYASKCFWIPAIAPILTPFLIIVALLTTGKSLGPWALVGGVLAGGFGECIFLGLALKGRGIALWPKWHGYNSDVRQVALQYIPLLVGSLLVSSVTVVDQSMAAWLQPGSLAALAYGNRMVSVVVGLSASSLAAAVIPYFSELVAEERWEACRRTLQTFTRILLMVMTPISIVLIAITPSLVRLVFQRGAFTAQDTAVVSRVQIMYALQIPFCAAGVLYVRMLTALKRNDLVMVSAGISLVLDVILNIVCMKFLGVAGIALSTSLFYAASLLFAFLMAGRLLSRNIAAHESKSTVTAQPSELLAAR